MDYFILTYSRWGECMLSNTMSHNEVLDGTMGQLSWDGNSLKHRKPERLSNIMMLL